MRKQAMSAMPTWLAVAAPILDAASPQSSGITVCSWLGNTGQWGDYSQWSNNLVPDGTNYAAEFGGSGAYTVNFGEIGYLTCASVEIDDPKATLSFTPACTLVVSSVVNVGMIDLENQGFGVLDVQTLSNGGTLLVDTVLGKYNDVLYVEGNASNNGVISVGNAATSFLDGAFAYFLGATANAGVITSTGAAQLEFGILDNYGTLSASCAGSLGSSGLILEASTLANSGTITLDGQGSFVTSEIDNTGLIKIGTGATAGSVQIFNTTLTNAGTILLGGEDQPDLSMGTVNNSGLIDLAPATGQYADFDFSTLTNTGTVIIGPGNTQVNGSDYIESGGKTVVDGLLLATVAIDGGEIQLSGGEIENSPFDQGGNTIEVEAGGTLSGFGTIKFYGAIVSPGILAVDGQLDASGGTLLVKGQLNVAGSLVVAAGALLDVTYGGDLSGNASLDGALNAGTSVAIGGAFLTNGGTITDVSGVTIGSGASLTGHGAINSPLAVEGEVSAAGGVLAVTGAVSGGGTLLANAGASLDFTGGGTFSGIVGGAGTLQVDGASVLDLSGAEISMAAIVVDAGASLFASGTIGGTMAVDGTLSVSVGTLTLSGGVTGTGALVAAAGATLDLAAGGALDTAIEGEGTVSLAGAYTLGTGALTVSNLVIDSGASLSGAGLLNAPTHNLGAIDAEGGVLTVTTDIAGGTLAADEGATLVLDGGGSFAGTLAGAGAIYIVRGMTIDGSTTLTGANMAARVPIHLAANTTLLESAGATFLLHTSPTQRAAILGSNTTDFINAGSLAAAGNGNAEVTGAFINSGNASIFSGTLSFMSAIANTGTLHAAGGLLQISESVSGKGIMEIGRAGTLSLLHGAHSGQTVDFLASQGNLDLTDPSLFFGQIDSFRSLDVIDLSNIKETSFTFSMGALTVKDGTETVSELRFSGSYTKSDFRLNGDGHDGTLIQFV